MKTITKLKPQVKNNKRVSVYLDGLYYCGLDLLTIMQNRLKVGQEIDENTLIEIQRESESHACFDSALNFISKSVKTEREIKDKLLSRGYIEEIVLEVLEKLRSYNFVNDKEYCEKYVSTYKNIKSKKLIKFELQKKGVNKLDVDETLQGIECEFDTAIKIAEKYVRNKEKNEKTFQKCYKYLLSKGFSYDDSLNATKKVINIEES